MLRRLFVVGMTSALARKPNLQRQTLVAEILERTWKGIKEGSPYHGAKDHYIVNLVTTDLDGFPSSRSVVAREIAPDFSYFRIQTRDTTRKVAELQRNRNVALSYVDQRGRGGWITFKGVADLAQRKDGDVDIHISVRKLEAYNHNVNLMQDKDKWEPEILVKDEGTGGAGPWRRVMYEAARGPVLLKGPGGG